MLKTYITDPKRRIRDFVYAEVHKHPEYNIETETFTYESSEDPPVIFKSVYAYNDYGVFYVGGVIQAYRLRNLSKFQSYDPKSTSGVACIGYNATQKKWCGWSHRAMVCFGEGDKIFEYDYGDENTLFKEHGHETIKNDEDAMLSARNFAEYVS